MRPAMGSAAARLTPVQPAQTRSQIKIVSPSSRANGQIAEMIPSLGHRSFNIGPENRRIDCAPRRALQARNSQLAEKTG
jgi:hypothetical protein